MKPSRWMILIAIALAARTGCLSCRCGSSPSHTIRFATFNIEDFPKSQRQIEGAFAEIATLDVGFVAVQELFDPDVFRRAARERLGPQWELVTEPIASVPTRHLGVLFDHDAWTFLSTRVHDETRLGGNHKGVLEVRLKSTHHDAIVRVLVVHLKAGGDGRDIRAKQYAALAGVVTAAQRSGEHVVVLGDFNATDDRGDRGDLARLASHNELVWGTEPLACSAFWDRDDGCPRSRLDHVLLWTKPSSVTAAGACATEGCDRQDSCPLYADEVSDHCPVVIEVSP